MASIGITLRSCSLFSQSSSFSQPFMTSNCLLVHQTFSYSSIFNWLDLGAYLVSSLLALSFRLHTYRLSLMLISFAAPDLLLRINDLGPTSQRVVGSVRYCACLDSPRLD